MFKFLGYILFGLTAAVAFVALIFGISLVFSIPVWLLWNWLMPVIFGLKPLTLIQAWGLTFLCSILFKSSNTNTTKRED